MLDLKLKQLQFETAVWKRQLESMVNENINQKYRLSEILKDRFDMNLLEELDNFQSRFIEQDELFKLLKSDIKKMDNLLGDESYDTEEAYSKLKKLRANINTAEQQFNKLKLEFNNYLGDHL